MVVPDDKCPYCTTPSPTACAETGFSEEPPSTPSFPPVAIKRFEYQSYGESSYANQEQRKGNSSSGDSKSSTVGTVQGNLKKRISTLPEEHFEHQRPEDPENANQTPQLSGPNEDSEVSAGTVPIALPEAVPVAVDEAQQEQLPEASAEERAHGPRKSSASASRWQEARDHRPRIPSAYLSRQ